MTKTVFGVFSYRRDAEDAINELESLGYDPKDVSIIMRNRDDLKSMEETTGASRMASNTASGAAAGAVLGGLAGLLGAFVIPGIGAILIGGPVAAALGLSGAAATTVSGAVTGALAGGMIGALTSLGLPEEDARYYESRINEGGILVAVPARRGEEMEVRQVLEDYNADTIKTIDNIDRTETRKSARMKDEEEYTPAYFSEVDRDKDEDMTESPRRRRSKR